MPAAVLAAGALSGLGTGTGAGSITPGPINPASAFAQTSPLGQWVNPLDGALPGAGEGAKDTRRIDNSKIARRIITCTDLKLGWAVVEVQAAVAAWTVQAICNAR